MSPLARHLEPEIMDDPALDGERHREALRGLERINRWSSSSRIVWFPIKTLAQERTFSPLRVLDIATGAGDVPIQLWHRARRAGLPLEVDGCDQSPRAIEYAKK